MVKDMRSWFAERVVKDDNAKCRTAELYEDYCAYMGGDTLLQRARLNLMGVKRFSNTLRDAYGCAFTKVSVMYAVGIRLCNHLDSDV